jgi:hypothetical protein
MPNKTLHTNRRSGLGFGLSAGLFYTSQPHHVTVRVAVGELDSSGPNKLPALIKVHPN